MPGDMGKAACVCCSNSIRVYDWCLRLYDLFLKLAAAKSLCGFRDLA
jgi:hypothetical protein